MVWECGPHSPTACHVARLGCRAFLWFNRTHVCGCVHVRVGALRGGWPGGCTPCQIPRLLEHLKASLTAHLTGAMLSVVTVLLEVFAVAPVGRAFVLPATLALCQGVVIALDYNPGRFHDHPDVAAELFRLVRRTYPVPCVGCFGDCIDAVPLAWGSHGPALPFWGS